MHDFFCRDAKDMHYKILADRMRFFKEDKGGVQSMCEVMDELVKEGVEKGKAEGKAEERLISVRNLMDSLGLTAKQAMDALKIPAAEQTKLAASL